MGLNTQLTLVQNLAQDYYESHYSMTPKAQNIGLFWGRTPEEAVQGSTVPLTWCSISKYFAGAMATRTG